MQRKYWGLWSSLFILGAVGARGDDYYLSNGDQDATILVDEYRTLFGPGPKMWLLAILMVTARTISRSASFQP